MEKRFLVYLEDMEDEGITLSSLKKIKIEVFHLSSDSSRKAIKEGDKYFLVGVFANDPKKEMSKEEYKRLTNNNMSRVIKKTRYFISDSNGVISSLDIYERGNLAVLKLRSDDANMFRPCWLRQEVTEDKRYEDDNISFFGDPKNGSAIKGPGSLFYQVDITTKDITDEVGIRILAKGYQLLSVEEKIKLVYQETFNYLINKLKLLKFQNISDSVLTLDELLLLFDSKFVFEEDKIELFRFIIHYILGVIGDIQTPGISGISWFSSDEHLGEPLLDKGKFDFNCNQFTELVVNPKTSYTTIARYILDFLQNHFLEEFNKTLELKNPNINQEP